MKPTQVNGPTKGAKLLNKKFGFDAPATTGPHPVKPKLEGKVLVKKPGHTGPSLVKKRKGSGQNDAGNAI